MAESATPRATAFGLSRPRLIERRKPETRALFLADVSRMLLETLDSEDTLANVMRLALRELGAWGILDVLDQDGTIRRVAVLHPDSALQNLIAELETQYPPAEGDLIGAPRVTHTQQPELVSEVTPETLKLVSRDKRHLEILRTLGLCSYMVVPLKARGKLFGAFTFVAATDQQRFTPRDLLFAEDLAARSAAAMDTARLYKEAEQAREEAVAAVARAAIADRAKTDFLATMSHELRTPLNAIAGYAELLELGMRGPINDQQREAIRRIRKSQEHLLGIVNDILTFAKTETGRIPINPEPTAVLEALESARFLVEPLFEHNEIQFSLADCDPATYVIADRDRLQQILVNLLSNAAKFSWRGGAVTALCEAREHLVAIMIVDRGRGIDVSKQEAIFEPFVQLSTGLTRTADGSGLGLAISRELARLMGGDITVESNKGEGATFTLTLPLSPPGVPASA